MKSTKIFWGVFFVALGILILFNNFGVLNLNWNFLWKLWPFIFILWGISVLVKDTGLKWVFSALMALLIALVLFSSFKKAWSFFECDFDINDNYSVQELSSPYKPDIRYASLKIDVGAGKFKIDGTSDDLISAKTQGSFGKYFLKTDQDDSKAELYLGMEGKSFSIRGGSIKNAAEIKLHKDPVWDLEVDVGASSVELDLSSFKVKNVNINSGATSVKLKLSGLQDSANVAVDAGVSSVEILIPASLGGKINVDMGISSKNFEGFHKAYDNEYLSDNYDTASKKVFIDFEGGVSSVKVKRY